jgi:hypothetical protein
MVAFESSLVKLRQVSPLAKAAELESMGLDPRSKTFWGLTGNGLQCVFCAPRVYGEGIILPSVKGAPWWSEKTYYGRKEVEEVLGREVPWTPQGSARSSFRSYMALTVGNCVKNWFRTKGRRHREETMEADPITGKIWEEDLEASGPSSEVLVDLKRGIQALEKGSKGRTKLRQAFFLSGL